MDLKVIGNKGVAIFLASENNNTSGVNGKDKIKIWIAVHTKENTGKKHTSEKISGTIPPLEQTI